MLAGFSGNRYELPQPLRDVLSADPIGDPWAGFTAAQAFARAGFRVLPVVPGGKGPISTGLFRQGAKSASDDRETIREAFVANPGANVAVAPDSTYVILDIDPRNGGSLEAADRVGMPIDAYRERSGSGGWHIPLTLPSGARAERSAILAPGVEIKGPGSFVISPHSRLDAGGWYRPDPDRDCWRWGQIAANWPFLDRLKRQETVTVDTTGATQQERRLARRVLHDLTHDRYGENVRYLIAGEWSKVRNDDGTQRYPSQSEADLSLVAMAVFGSGGNPRVLDCVMRMTWLHRPKWDEIHFDNGQTYGEGTIARALASSRWVSRGSFAPHTGIDAIRAMITVGTDMLAGQESGAAETLRPLTVFMLLHFGLEGCKNRAVPTLLAFLLGVQESGPESSFSRPENWMRVPVSDLADHLGLDRTAIHRALEKLELAGAIERDVTVSHASGKPRKVSLVRFVAGMDSIP